MTPERKPRKPEVFTPDDPDLKMTAPPVETALARASGGRPGVAEGPAGATSGSADPAEGPAAPRFNAEVAERGFRWGTLLLATGGILASIALALSFARFVSIAVERNDWLGWTAFVLLALMAVSAVALIGREIVGFFRLRRLGTLREDAERALREKDRELEARVLRRLTGPLEHRPEHKWALARLTEHQRDVRDPGDLLALADRELLMTLDGEARRTVAGAARRIATVTAISPTALLTVSWVLIENLRLLRRLAGLYGGRPGFFATAKLARMVFTHIVATGGVALTDDLLGQFLGQDLLRRLSRRLGESVFNAALTARIGAAAIEVIRPLPYIEAPRIRARDFLGEITRRAKAESEAEGSSTANRR